MAVTLPIRDLRVKAPSRGGRSAGETAVSRAPVPLSGAVIVAALTGPVMDGAFPDLGVWPLAFVGIALVLIVLRGRRAGRRLPRRARLRAQLLSRAHPMGDPVPRHRPLARPVDARSALRGCRQHADHPRLSLDPAALAGQGRTRGRSSIPAAGRLGGHRATRSAAPRHRRPLDRTRGDLRGVALRRILMGSCRDVPVGEPFRRPVRLDGHFRGELRDGLAGGIRHRADPRCSRRVARRSWPRRSAQGEPGARRSRHARHRDGRTAGRAGLADSDGWHAEGRRHPGQHASPATSISAATRARSSTATSPRPFRCSATTSTSSSGRRAPRSRPARGSGGRAGHRPRHSGGGRADHPGHDHPTRERHLQLVPALAAGARSDRHLRQAPPGAVRRVRAGSGVLGAVRARPDRADRARLHAGHERSRVRSRLHPRSRRAGGGEHLLRHRRRCAHAAVRDRRRRGDHSRRATAPTSAAPTRASSSSRSLASGPSRRAARSSMLRRSARRPSSLPTDRLWTGCPRSRRALSSTRSTCTRGRPPRSWSAHNSSSLCHSSGWRRCC